MPRRRRRRHQHLQRARARRGEAVYPARRASAGSPPRRAPSPWSRSPAAWRSRRARPSSSAHGLVDVIVGTRRVGCSRSWWSRQRRPARTAGRPRRQRRRGVSVRGDAAQRSGAGLGDDHRGLQRVLHLLRRPVHARAGADAAQGGHSRRGARTPPRPATARSSCSGRSSITTRRRTIRACDFAGAARGGRTRSPGIERIRFASPHPRHVTHRLIAAIRDIPQVCKHLHLPVQSGSTRVLRAMRRRYSRESYLEIVDACARAVPAIALSTDMIVGFPGETAADFDETMSLTEARPLPQHVLVQVLRAAEHARVQAPRRRCA